MNTNNMDIEILIRETEKISEAKPILSLDDLKKAKRLFYELNDNWGKTWLGVYTEVFLREQSNFFEYFKKHLDNNVFKSEEDLFKSLIHHRFKYI